jgi:cell division protease FtsH
MQASWWLSFVLLLGLNYALLILCVPSNIPRTELSYTFFRQQVSAGNVAEINSRGYHPGTFQAPVSCPWGAGANEHPLTDISTVRPPFADPVPGELLNQQGVTIIARPIDKPAYPY